MSIKAIIYSKFDTQEGPKIVHKVPDDAVLTGADVLIPPNTNALLSFSSISRFLIPRQSLCGNLISLTPPPLTANSPQCLILSYPVCLTSSHYSRNEFIFNFALVLSPPHTIDIPSYKSVVTKFAQLMRSLEEQSHFLSDDTSPSGTGKIYSLCEMLMEDLNNYCECMIPIDEVNTLNIKLFPTLPNPAPVKAWHVPLFTVYIDQFMDENWDLTMQRIIPYINGVNSVKRIAFLADADIKFTQKCIRHLLYYGCVLLLDIFSFNAIYAPTAEFRDLIATDSEMQAECARYVNTAFEQIRQENAFTTASDIPNSLRSSHTGITIPYSTDEDIWPLTGKGGVVDGVGIVQLFANLRQGLSVRQWYAQNTNMLANIDVRRFITFGIIKGFLYRVHRYAIRTTDITTGSSTVTPSPKAVIGQGRRRRHSKPQETDDSGDDYARESKMIAKITNFLDGTHCFDEICTEVGISEKELTKCFEGHEIGEVVVICK